MRKNLVCPLAFIILGVSSLCAQSDSTLFSIDSLGTKFDSTYNEVEKIENFDPSIYYSKDYAASKIAVRRFDTAEWRKLTQNLDYKESPQKKFEPPKKYKPFTFSEDFKSFVRLFMWLALISGLVALVWLVVSRRGFKNLFNKNNRIGSEEQIVDYHAIDEEEITNNDFPTLIKAALRDKNYIMALRLNYLYTLKSLEEAELIRWKRDKTNGNYVRELAISPEFQSPFKILTREFEFYFYGKFPFEENQYNNVANAFNNFIEKVQLHASKNKMGEDEKNI